MPPIPQPAKPRKLNVTLNLRAPSLGFVAPGIATFLRSDARLARVAPPAPPTRTAGSAAAAPTTAANAPSRETTTAMKSASDAVPGSVSDSASAAGAASEPTPAADTVPSAAARREANPPAASAGASAATGNAAAAGADARTAAAAPAPADAATPATHTDAQPAAAAAAAVPESVGGTAQELLVDDALHAAERAVAAAQDSLADAFVEPPAMSAPPVATTNDGADATPAPATSEAAAPVASTPADDELAECAFGNTNDVQFAVPADAATVAAGAANTRCPGAATLLVVPDPRPERAPDFADAAITAAEAVADFAADMAAEITDGDVAVPAQRASDDDDRDLRDEDYTGSTSGAIEDATRALADFIAPRALALAVDIDALVKNCDALGNSAASSETGLDDLLDATGPAADAMAEAAAAEAQDALPPMAAQADGSAVDASRMEPTATPDAKPDAGVTDSNLFAESTPANSAAPFAEANAGATDTDLFAATSPTPSASPFAEANTSPAPTAPAATDAQLGAAMRALQDDVRATLAPWREGVPPALSTALAPIREQLDRHGELLAQHATGLQGLETHVARAAAAVATAATPAAAAHPVDAPAPSTPAAIAAPPAGASAVHRAIAVSCLGAAWSVVLWWKTGSVALAMGMSVAATALSTLLARKSGPLA